MDCFAAVNHSCPPGSVPCVITNVYMFVRMQEWDPLPNIHVREDAGRDWELKTIDYSQFGITLTSGFLTNVHCNIMGGNPL